MNRDRNTHASDPHAGQNGSHSLPDGRPDHHTTNRGDKNAAITGASPRFAGFQDASLHQPSSRRRSTELPPTLFQLPNRNTNQADTEPASSQFAIHQGHGGPPASHVDSPPGSQNQSNPSGPHPPLDSNSAIPNHGEIDEQGNYLRHDVPRVEEPIASQPNTAESQAAQPRDSQQQQIAAYRDAPPMTWRQQSHTPWATRTVVVILVLLMATVSFFAGRGLDRSRGDGTDVVAEVDSKIGEQEIILDDLGETVVVITEEPMASDDVVSSDNLSAEQIAAEDSSIEPPAESDEPESFDLESSPPSYIAETFEPELNTDHNLLDATPSGAAEPQLAAPQIAAADTSLEEELAALANDIPELSDSIDSVVSYRTNEDIQPDQSEPVDETTDKLPQGMADRLKLEDGLRYTSTPFPIGNFLEILRRWETSSLE